MKTVSIRMRHVPHALEVTKIALSQCANLPAKLWVLQQMLWLYRQRAKLWHDGRNWWGTFAAAPTYKNCAISPRFSEVVHRLRQHAK